MKCSVLYLRYYVTILTITISAILLVSCTQNKFVDFYVEGVSNPIISLNGTWKINTNPPREFWAIQILNEEWKEIQVPGECAMQGFTIKHDVPFVYMKRIEMKEKLFLFIVTEMSVQG